MKVRTVFALALFCVALAPVGAKADQAQDDQNACMSDAMTVCGQFIPDRERVGTCLVQNRSRISAPCRAAIVRFNSPTASRAKTSTVR
jgi:hypothetical protein